MTWQDDGGGRLEKQLTEIAVRLVLTAEIKYCELFFRQYQRLVKRKAEFEEEERQRKLGAQLAERERRKRNTLLKIQSSLAPTPRATRWPLALVFLCTLVLISVLFFTHVRHTRIDFDATVSEITFTVDDQTRFSPPVAGELIFFPRFLKIPRPATILRCAIWPFFSSI